MFGEYLSNEYVRAAVILLIVYIAVKAVIFIVGRILPRLTAKTKTTLDDEILERVSGPITWIAMVAGVRFVFGQLSLGESYSATIEGILISVIILFAGILVYHILDSVVIILFSNIAAKARVKVNESLLLFFKSILKFIAAVGIFLAILASWGIEIGPLLAGLGVAGIAIAFALQSTLSNVFGGVSILMDRSINKGDLVNLEDGTSGKVVRVGLRSTRIRTFDNEIMIVPNGKLSEGNIKNVALPEPKTRVVVPFGVAYGTDIDKVKKLVLAEIKKVENYIPNPEPSVKFLEMADSSLNFKAFFYVNSYDNRFGALDEANTRIYNLLNKHKIEIPFPQMDVHVKK